MSKFLAGSFMSQVLHNMAQVNEGIKTSHEIGEQFVSMLEASSSFIELSQDLFSKDSIDLSKFPSHRFKTFNANSRAIMNTILPWSSYNTVDGQIFGGVYLENKRAKSHSIPDRAFNKMQDLVSSDSTVLEVGCFEGHYSATLAMKCRSVYAFDSRIENVLKTLVRVWALGLEKKVSVDLLNIENDDIASFYQSRGVKEFDLIYHRGVLYHVNDSVGHLANIAPLGKALYLHTHYATDDQVNDHMNTPLGTFPIYAYSEPSAKTFSPFAGMTSLASWLRKDDLLLILTKLGFNEIEISSDVEERNGHRIELIAKRKI